MKVIKIYSERWHLEFICSPTMKFTGTIVPAGINFVLLKPSDENDEII
jgi:hypothetical protein